MRQVRLLAGRYRVLGRLSAGPKGALWLAEEASSSRPVVIAQVSETKAQWLKASVGVSHAHLAELLRVVRPVVRAELPLAEGESVPEAVAIAALVAGRTLAQALLNTPLPPFQAVRCTAYIASAIDALHRRGAAHGSVSQRSVVLERADEGPSPVLMQLNEPPHVTFASPERLHGSGPSLQDDVWALHVLLYAALTGRPPYRGSDAQTIQQAMHTIEPAPLRGAGIRDERLQSILDRGLCLTWDERTRSVFDLESELFDWLSQNTPKDSERPKRPALDESLPKRAPEQEARPAAAQPMQHPRTATLRYGVDTEQLAQPTSIPDRPAAAPAIPDLDLPPPKPSPETKPTPPASVAPPPPKPKPVPPPAPKLAAPPPPKPKVAPKPVAPPAERPAAPPPKLAPPPKPKDVVPPAPKPVAVVPRTSAPEITIEPVRPPSLSEAAVLAGEAGDELPASVASLVANKEAAPEQQPWAAFEFKPGPDVQLPGLRPVTAQKESGNRALFIGAIGAAGLVALLIVFGVFLAVRAMGQGDDDTSHSAAAPVIESSAPAIPPAASTAPVPPEQPKVALDGSPEEITRCVAAYFPDGTFDGLQDLAFVCEHRDARKGASIMRSRIVLGARGNISEAMHEWSRLEWHELAAYAIFRHGCCPNPEPLDLPPPVRSCGAVGTAADNLARAFVANDPKFDDRLVQFHRAADCAHYGKAPGYPYPSGPISGGQVTFAGFLKRNIERRRPY